LSKEDFKPVSHPVEIKSFLNEGAKISARVTIWRHQENKGTKKKISESQNTSKVYKSEFKRFHSKSNILTFSTPTGLSKKRLLEEDAQGKSVDFLFSLQLTRGQIFFKSTLVGIDAMGLKFICPEKIYRIQRRGEYRLKIPKWEKYTIQFRHPARPETRHVFRIVDISASGMAFVLPKSEASLLKLSDTIPRAGFIIRSKRIYVSFEVRYSKISEGYLKGTMVGVKFLQIQQTDSQYIASFVFDESRKYFSSFV
jgi:c-di-GMP-binding flagellar brake protein YcgR